ncbi:MAG TPA: hypothetical protein VG889_17630 [Rhizomicrobium sp.]|nr:hypothetical protein [Rhizomicrobium sp.]
MHKRAFAALAASSVLLSACGTLPNVTYRYYPAKSVTTLSVTQTVACNADHELLVSSAVVAPVTAYSANYSSEAGELYVPSIDRKWADADASFTFSDDGRLKGINAQLTGQGETILKSAITLGTAIAGAAAAFSAPVRIKHNDKNENDKEECDTLAKWVGDGKPATLTYTKVLDLYTASTKETDPCDPRIYKRNDAGNCVPFADVTPADAPNDALAKTIDPAGDKDAWVSDRLLYNRLKDKLPKLSFDVKWSFFRHPASYMAADKSKDDFTTIKLQDTASAHLDFKAGDVWIGGAAVTVPVEGSLYALAVPKAGMFGSRKIVLTLSDAGAINSLEYGKGNGAAGAMNVVSSAVTAATPAPPSSP